MKKVINLKLRAFTLIELLIVISIIGVLVTISMTSFASAQKRSRDTTRKAQTLNISSALERYRSANNVYAPEYCAKRPTNNCSSGATYFGGVGNCESRVSDDIDTTGQEPAFDVDGTNSATINASGFLLPFMGKPRTFSSTISDASADVQSADTCFFGNSIISTKMKDGRIRMNIESNRYWVYATLENTNDKRSPAGGKCWSKIGALDENAKYYSGVFMAFDTVCGAPETKYKIFARGSYGEPSP